MKQRRFALAATLIAVVVLAVAALRSRNVDVAAPHPRPVLSVELTHAEEALLPVRVPASGHVAAWQEASVGAEGDGLRLVAVHVNVGDTVKQGQVLALFDAGIVDAELAEARAALAQAEAAAAEAGSNAQRAATLSATGALSRQQIQQYRIAATTARARVDAARAVERRSRLRRAQTQVRAPGDGIVTARPATVGAVVPAGQELFRLIRDGRLEWRAAVAESDMDKLAPGQVAEIRVAGQAPLRGSLRSLSPAIDTATHSGLVYVDLPRGAAVRAGAFARGHVEIGETRSLTLPQSAVLLRDGFHYVMRVGPASTVLATRVSVGARVGDRIAITAGLAENDSVVAAGAGFLSDGDAVRVVGGPAAAGAAAAGSGP